MSKESQAGSRPGLKAGRSNEFTLIMNLKPGGAERLRKKMALILNLETKTKSLCRSNRYASRS